MHQIKTSLNGSPVRDSQRRYARPAFQVVEISQESKPVGIQYPEELTLQLNYVSDLRPKPLTAKPPFTPWSGTAAKAAHSQLSTEEQADIALSAIEVKLGDVCELGTVQVLSEAA